MPSVKIDIKYDDQAVVSALQRLLDATGNLTPVFEDIGEYLLIRGDEIFSSEVDPFGEPWAELAPSTRRQKKNPKILTETTDLRGSANYQAGKDELQFGYNKIYAAIQHFGGQAGRNQSAEIPARPFLGISDTDRDQILAIIDDHLQTAIRAR